MRARPYNVGIHTTAGGRHGGCLGYSLQCKPIQQDCSVSSGPDILADVVQCHFITLCYQSLLHDTSLVYFIFDHMYQCTFIMHSL